MQKVVIVGSGPAGSMCSYFLQKKGIDTLLVEKHSHPKHKPCAGGVSKTALDIMPFKIDKDVIETEIQGFRLVSPNFASFTFPSDESKGIIAKRSVLDKFLCDKALDAGAEIIENVQPKSITKDNGNYQIKLTDGQDLKTKYLVGADGVLSSVGKLANIRKIPLEQKGYAYQTFVPMNKEEINSFMLSYKTFLEIHINKMPMGYGWIFPNADGLNIGVGGSALSIIEEKRQGINHIDNFLKLLEKSRNDKVKLKPEKIYAAQLPAGGYKREIALDNILLVGDAAGFVDSFAGEGIYYAIESSKIAAESILKNNTEEDYSILADYYKKRIAKAFLGNLKQSLKFSYRLHDHLDLFFKAMKYLPEATHVFSELADGKGYKWANNYFMIRSFKILGRALLAKIGLWHDKTDIYCKDFRDLSSK
ncbi:MAG: NAD(P)/FAD-dependent oxidoreductase [Candidatus Heimdallarchaeota archaeon]